MRSLKKVAYRARDFLMRPVRDQSGTNFSFADVAAQLQLKLAYKALLDSGQRLPSLRDVGFKVLSQTDEDGILLYIFSIIGTHNKKSVEICAGNGIECNSSNLIIHHGWSGLLIDGNDKLVEAGKEFYRRNRYTYVYPPTFAHAWITRDNVNDVIANAGFEGEIDLLSIDMDGNDYWIWDKIDIINPRVVVVEYQDMLGPERALTVPYRDDFNAYVYPSTDGMPNFCGASLPAFVKLARRKGYRLVGRNQYCYNAFFIRNDLAERSIPEIRIEECFTHPKVAWGMKERLPTTQTYPWVEV
jgi:hypothetical protein